MRKILVGLDMYHEQFGALPAAACWDANALSSPDLHLSKHWRVFVKENWAIQILPFLEQQTLFEKFDPQAPIAAKANTEIREKTMAEFSCPADSFARNDNPFVHSPQPNQSIIFARGNYGINGGTHSYYSTSGDTSSPTGDHCHLVNHELGQFEYWGNGIAGINKSFTYDEFESGRSHLVAVNEMRAGIDPEDLRGSWALGLIGSSVTWGHGVNGDDYCPNNLWARSDDIQGGGRLNEKYGPEKLIEMGMPCVSYVDVNQNAGSRSKHPGGVNVGFLDGAVRFVSDNINPSLWHVLHSRETPKSTIDNKHIESSWPGAIAESPQPKRSSPNSESSFSNSLGVKFVMIPAGEFTMGVPDAGYGNDVPPETPPHKVTIASPFHLSTTEVSVEAFRQVMGSSSGEMNEAQQNFPVTDITWFDAVEFCRRLTDSPEEKAAGRSYRLPTEAEWEFACREASSNHQVSRIQAIREGAAAGLRQKNSNLAPIASHQCNSLGLFDMRGNAWEWCSDWFDRDYYSRSREIDPAGPISGYMKVVRGSDWIYVGEGCYINYPILAPWKSSPFIGFRIVAILPD